jgi:hypothetical protein
MYISDASISDGTYRVWAQTESEDGQKSALSNVLTIPVPVATTAGLAAAAALADTAGGSTLLYIILIGALIFYIGYRYYRSRLEKK